MSKVLVISGHPELSKSFTNTVILEQLSAGLEDVEIRRLDSLYPNYQIDVNAEQQALVEADVIVLQFPYYWYSMPALMKKWMDDVFSFNFAYGPQGDKLKGKDFILSFTVGGPEEAYSPLGYNHFSIEQLMRPLEQTAYLAGMNYRKPVYTHGMVYIPGVYNELDQVQAKARDHANRLMAQISDITESASSRIRKLVAQWFAQFDQLPEQSEFFTGHLSNDLNLVMPEGSFKGHEGFRDWYAFARRTFKPGCEHKVEQTLVTEKEGGYQVDLRIRLDAETFPESEPKGETISLLVNETWQVTIDETGHVTIHDYQVTPVA
ncbi:NAD(P)H-dependent oxidoreductase [Ferrimonas aestuarii]|uniref:NAD(P)H-dependent oxidoreductase n=1 Tax=Ferrimonas aestuarii TaxID=2569539 RepID=A0A4U1BUR8_9GAMM|nr:NAD(P)H-dependent oxidoreductase [Ferrimonas aestuarii]TKB58331.1 NAD(P)H-dependent oxidoreductase [Ferrimonas aestuarii]